MTIPLPMMFRSTMPAPSFSSSTGRRGVGTRLQQVAAEASADAYGGVVRVVAVRNWLPQSRFRLNCTLAMEFAVWPSRRTA